MLSRRLPFPKGEVLIYAGVALQLSRCQLVNGAIPRKIIRGAIIGMTTALKYGGPTEIFPRFKASMARDRAFPIK